METAPSLVKSMQHHSFISVKFYIDFQYFMFAQIAHHCTHYRESKSSNYLVATGNLGQETKTQPFTDVPSISTGCGRGQSSQVQPTPPPPPRFCCWCPSCFPWMGNGAGSSTEAAHSLRVRVHAVSAAPGWSPRLSSPGGAGQRLCSLLHSTADEPCQFLNEH